MGTEGDRELVLFDGLLDGSPRETYRQRLPGQRGQRSTVSQAKLVAMNQATEVLNGTVFCWDLSDGTQVFQTDPARPFQSKVSFSLDKKLMTLVDTSGVHIVDTKTGMDLGFIRMESPSPSTAPFDKNGNRIALCSEDAWSIYDLETMEQRKPQTATWKIDGRRSGWIGPDLLLAETSVADPLFWLLCIEPTMSFWVSEVVPIILQWMSPAFSCLLVERIQSTLGDSALENELAILCSLTSRRFVHRASLPMAFR